MRNALLNIKDWVSRHEYLTVVSLFSLAFVVRILIVIIFGTSLAFRGDDGGYHGYASEMIKGWNWIFGSDFHDSTRPPGWPLLLSLVYRIFGENNYIAAFTINALMGAIACYFIYKIARLAFKEEMIAYLSFLWAIFYLYYIFYIPRLIREPLVILLFVLSFYVLLKYLLFGMQKYLIIFVIVFAYLCHVDPRYAFYYPFLIVPFLLYQPRKCAIKNYLKAIALTLLILLPWTIRNYHTYGRFVFMNTRSFDSKVFLENPTVKHGDGKLAFYSNTFWNIFKSKIDYTVKRKQHISEEERSLIRKGKNPNKRSKELLEAVKKDIYPATDFWPRKWWFLKEYFRPMRVHGDFRPYPADKFVRNWSLHTNIGIMLCYGLLWPLFFIGGICLYKKNKKLLYLFLFPIVVQAMLHFLQWGMPRYRVPTDAFLIIIAMYGLGSFVFKERMLDKPVGKS